MRIQLLVSPAYQNKDSDMGKNLASEDSYLSTQNFSQILHVSSNPGIWFILKVGHSCEINIDIDGYVKEKVELYLPLLSCGD